MTCFYHKNRFRGCQLRKLHRWNFEKRTTRGKTDQNVSKFNNKYLITKCIINHAANCGFLMTTWTGKPRNLGMINMADNLVRGKKYNSTFFALTKGILNMGTEKFSHDHTTGLVANHFLRHNFLVRANHEQFHSSSNFFQTQLNCFMWQLWTGPTMLPSVVRLISTCNYVKSCFTWQLSWGPMMLPSIVRLISMQNNCKSCSTRQLLVGPMKMLSLIVRLISVFNNTLHCSSWQRLAGPTMLPLTVRLISMINNNYEILHANSLHANKMSYSQKLTNDRPALDEQTTELLGRFSRTRHLNYKDIMLVLDLHGKGYGGVRLNSLVPRAQKEKAETERLLARLLSSQDLNAETLVIRQALLQATTMTLRSVNSVHNCSEEGLGPMDLRFLRSVKRWIADNTQCVAMSHDLGGAKRRHSESEDEETEDAPDAILLTDEQLDILCDSLRAIETEFRTTLRSEVILEENSVAASRLLNQVPPKQRYNALVLAGVHEEVPLEAIALLARHLGAMGFAADMDAFERLVESGTERLRTKGSQYHSVLIPLQAPQLAMHGGTPFLVGDEVVPPTAFIVKDLPRPKMEREQFGSGRVDYMRQTYYVHATQIPQGTRTQVCLLRGIGMDQGIFEYSIAAATKAVHDAAAVSLSLFPDSCLMTCVQYHHRYVRNNSGERNAKATYTRANELALHVFTVNEGFDVDEYELVSQIRKNLTSGPKGNILQAGGLHFLVCPDAQSQEFLYHNLPDEIINPAGLQFSEISSLSEGLTLEEIVHVLVQSCYDFHRIGFLYVQRQTEIDIKTGNIAPQGTKHDTLIVAWIGEVGEIARVSLRLLCPGESGRHSPILGNVPGHVKFKAIDSLMRLHIQPGPDGRPGKAKYQGRGITVAGPSDITKPVPRRREHDRPLLTGARLGLNEADVWVNTHETGSYSTPFPRGGGQLRESHFLTPSSRTSHATPSSALSLASDRSVASSSYSGGKTPGSSELTLGSFEQLREMVREQMQEERERVSEREAKRDAQDRDNRVSQEAMIKTAVQAAVTQSMSFAFGSQDFANMLANAVATATSQPPPSGTGPSPHANRQHE